jgi:phosphoribosylcarboxyaminoimidazole (NCAIR) mutase
MAAAPKQSANANAIQYPGIPVCLAGADGAGALLPEPAPTFAGATPVPVIAIPQFSRKYDSVELYLFPMTKLTELG